MLKYLEDIKPNAEQLRKINYYRYRLEKTIIREYKIKEHTIALESIGDFIDI